MRGRTLASLAWLGTIAGAYTPLSDASLQSIPPAGPDFDIHTGAILSPILIPRVPGTPGSDKVLDHFADFWRRSLPLWDVTYQNSTQVTPTSDGRAIPFRNFIASRDPPWSQPGDVGRLTLVAHYDSLSHPEGFIGAIDSAAPCAMIMHAARSIDEALTRRWTRMQAEHADNDGLEDFEEHRGVQVLFLDGEEAFRSWNDDDSLYGARSLAEEWEMTQHSAMSAYRSPLQSIELFVLLDLLGARDTYIPSYYKTTHWAYQKMAEAETRLRDLGLMTSRTEQNHPSNFLFEPQKQDNAVWLGGRIGDDHVPFMHRGVDILHLIPAKFPSVWHKLEDDGEHLDAVVVEDWARLVTAFAAEWMDLEGFMGNEQEAKSSDGQQRPKDELMT